MKCPSCQADNLPDSRFCHRCATPLPSDIAGATLSYTKTMVTPFEDLSRGTIFADRYEIIEELGKGGMGKVYKVYDLKIKEVVALKLIKPEIGFNEKAVERFKNELKFARKISHRHVCRLYDLGEFGLAHFITMEYVEGEDLKKFIRRAGYIVPPKAVSIAKQVCEGLAEAHRLDVVHRDLKPQNVMIDREGNARIMDFGLARFMEADGITGSGVMLGTPEYMSPEQVDLKDVDARTDFYSLGVIMHEMATGKVPFEGETPLSIAIKHKNEKPRDSRETNPLIPESFAHMILKCLEKDRTKRYQSAGELLQDLTRIEQGLPAAIKEISKSEPRGSREITVKFQLRKVILPALVLLCALIVVFIALKKTGRDVPKTGRPSGRAVFSEKMPAGPPSPPRGDVQGQLGSGGGPDLWNRMGGEISKYLSSKDGRDIKDLEKLTETIKGILPEKGPYVDAWNNVVERINREKKLGDPRKSEASRPSGPEVQGDMQKLLSLVAEREAAQKAKDSMAAAKSQAQQKANLDKNLLFRLAWYEETNADEAFAKNDYSGSKALYRILEKLYAICPQCANDKSCVEALRQFAGNLKKDVEQKGAASADAWLYEYAGEIENQAAAFLEKKDLENAGGAYIRSAFLYEKLKETAAANKI
jgi:serine/threonine protein kinase